MIIDGQLTSDPTLLREGWANYYEKLATPASKPVWNSTTLEDAKVKVTKKVEVQVNPKNYSL